MDSLQIPDLSEQLQHILQQSPNSDTDSFQVTFSFCFFVVTKNGN